MNKTKTMRITEAKMLETKVPNGKLLLNKESTPFEVRKRAKLPKPPPRKIKR